MDVGLIDAQVCFQDGNIVQHVKNQRKPQKYVKNNNCLVVSKFVCVFQRFFSFKIVQLDFQVNTTINIQVGHG